jgi:GR25 family glycosyltransferase involved in LPS biosynthesis
MKNSLIILFIFTFSVLISAVERNWLNKYATKIYSLTLSRRIKHVETLANHLNTDITIFQAPDRFNYTLEKLTKEGLYKRGGKSISVAQICCYIGHLFIMQKFLAETKGMPDNTVALILEDDAIVLDNIELYKEMLDLFFSNLPNDLDWDMLKADRCLENCGAVQNINDFWVKTANADCTHGYFITRRGAEKILKDYGFPVTDMYDEALRRAMHSGHVKIYAPSVNFFKQEKKLDTEIPESGKGVDGGPPKFCQYGSRNFNTYDIYVLIKLFEKYSYPFTLM